MAGVGVFGNPGSIESPRQLKNHEKDERRHKKETLVGQTLLSGTGLPDKSVWPTVPHKHRGNSFNAGQTGVSGPLKAVSDPRFDSAFFRALSCFSWFLLVFPGFLPLL